MPVPQHEPIDSPDLTTTFEYNGLEPPTLRDVYEARETVERYVPRSPLVRSEALSAELDADVYLKREDTLPTGSFKIRGFHALMADLDASFAERGVITATSGNHGRAMAAAAREFGVPAYVVVPDSIENEEKIAALERLGAEVLRRGADGEAARDWAAEQAAEEGYRYVHGGNEPALVAGRASGGLEVMEDLPETDVLFNPVGGGSSAAGYAMTVGSILGADVIGVQTAGADSVYQAWKTGELELQETADTAVEGLATRTPFWLPLQIMREHLTDMVRVEDEAVHDAIYRLMADDSVLAEGAGAATTAGALSMGDELAGKTVVIVISGGNISTAQVRDVIDSRW